MSQAMKTLQLHPQAENLCQLLAAIVLRILVDEQPRKPAQNINLVPEHRKEET